MNTMKKTAAGVVLGGSLLAAGGLSLAHAAPPESQSFVGDGKVNATLTVDGQEIGVIQDISVASAASLATAVCPEANLAPVLPQLDANQIQTVPACVSATGGLSYTFAQNTLQNGPQNGPGAAEVAPGQNRNTATTPPSAAPTTPGQMGR